MRNLLSSLLAVESVFGNFAPDVEKDIKDRLELWENTFKTRGQKEKAEKVKKLKDYIDIPF